MSELGQESNEIEKQGSVPDGEPVPQGGGGPDRGAGFVRSLYEWVETFVLALVAVVVLFTFFMRAMTVVGPSMEQTLHQGDRLFISNLFYTPKTGDIVVVQDPHFSEPIIKRVIATGGQTVDIDFDAWRVTVDGVALEEDYVNYLDGTPMRGQGYGLSYPYTVESGHVFVMGDNRNNSADSRMIGPIEERRIVGRVLFRIFPLAKFGFVH